MIHARALEKKTKVLIVNDDPLELNALTAGLEAEGFTVGGTTDPLNALELVSAADYNVVLIDLMISNMNGLQLARRIRDLRPRANTVLMSDYLLSPIQLAKADTGAIGFIPMPCRFTEIADFIREKTRPAEYTEENVELRTVSPSPFDVLTVRYSF